MKRGLSRLSKRMFRRGQAGQTLVILAFGFIVLLAFVGIVTDVSLMFVRYSSLRRAVDAAAVAAAGQMRRAAATDEEIVRAKAEGGTPEEIEDRANGYAFARNIASVNLAARQFIELYGLSPTSVVVDTCATLPPYDPANPADPELECDPDEQPRKLVRVTAQVNSPTVFLRLIGWGDVLLEATAISETAVLDVVMIFDVSESMANQTSYKDWDAWHPDRKTVHYMPPFMYFGPDQASVYMRSGTDDFEAIWRSALLSTQNDINNDTSGIYASVPYMATYDANGTVIDVSQPTADDLAKRQPRLDCRVRFFPAAQQIPRIPNGVGEYGFDAVHQEYTAYLRKYWDPSGTFPTRYDGFIGAYNYFGCCNDPGNSVLTDITLPDFNFSDLICQPMKRVRDATEEFLNRIDFSRGDRVAFVTFDRSAYLVDPDGTTGGADGTGPQTHMMTAQSNAVDALQQIVGVRAEPNFYADTNGDGLWDSFVVGGAPYGAGGRAVNYDTPGGFNTTPLGTLNEYPVKDNCLFQNASLPYPHSLYSASPNANPAFNFWPRYPTPLSGRSVYQGLDSYMHPPLNDPEWEAQLPASWTPAQREALKPLFAYELRAGCRGSNIGAALRVANNALVDPQTIRTNGAVWVMVMLGDGAAAGTDPVKRNGSTLNAPNFYNAPFNASDPSQNQPPLAGDYGVYGVCPYGRPGEEPGALIDQNWSTGFPYCMDAIPHSRHFCFDPRIKDTSGIYIDIGRPECADPDYYDADDFARDWADFIGLTDPFPALLTADQLNRTDLILPTIFTIGFGLDFNVEPTGSQTRCEANIGDCLGEELLRYIADVGDNNQIDTDYQQDCRDNGKCGDKSVAPGGFGARGPCEGPLNNGATDIDLVPPGVWEQTIINPLPPGESCGNYFNAPDADELQEVFDTIASRMFTRLTR